MHRTHLRTVIAWTIGVGLLAFGVAPLAQRATREQQVVVSVLDRDGNLVSGLAPSDFTVREDGVAREVLRVEQAAAPMQIALLVDTSAGIQTMIRDLRNGVQAFSQAIWAKSPDSDVMLMEFGERPNQLSPATTTAAVLARGIDRLSEHSGAGAYLLEAITEASAALKKRGAKRPVVVVFVREASPEFSELLYEHVQDALKAGRASLWTLVLQSRRGSNLTDADRNRNVVLGDVASRTGGTRELLLDQMGIEPDFQRLANRLTSQYAVTYARPESLIPPSKLDVTTKRAGARALAPQWTGQ
jgi:VWFA-related protein